MRINSTNKGYSLVEAIIYVAVLSLFFIVIVSSLVSFTKPYKELNALRLIERSGLESMEKITREIRSATSVDLGGSVLGVNPGALSLVTNVSGVSTTTRFYLDNGVIKLDVNGSYYGPLTNTGVTVTNLVFRRMTNPISEAIKVNMTVEINIGSTTRSKDYQSTIIIKNVSS